MKGNEEQQEMVTIWQKMIDGTGLVLPELQPMFFEDFEFWMPRKLAKTLRIFVEIDHIDNKGVTFWLERIRPVFPMLWSGHEFSRKTLTELMTTP